jgi:hypothetical protein
MPDKVPVKSEKGKQILAHAMQKDYCVLEFSTTDDGVNQVMDITEHVQELEEIANA